MMRKVKVLPYVLGASFSMAFFGVAACAVNSTSVSNAMTTASEALMAANVLASAYEAMPPCQQPAGTLCAQATVVAKISQALAAANEAYTVAKASQSAGDIAALTTAISALTALVPPATTHSQPAAS